MNGQDALRKLIEEDEERERQRIKEEKDEKLLNKYEKLWLFDIYCIWVVMEDRFGVKPEPVQGTTITRFNYHRPKWFGGFFGFAYRHNQPGNCQYDTDAVTRMITPDNLNKIL